MYSSCLGLGRAVYQIFLTRLVVKFEVFVCLLIEKPEVSHLHRAGLLSLDGVVHYSYCGGIVYVDWYLWLGVTYFGKCELDDSCFFCIEKKCVEFCLGCRRCNKFEYGTRDYNFTIELDWFAITWEAPHEKYPPAWMRPLPADK